MRKFIAGFVALFIFMLVLNYSLLAAPEARIVINGREHKVDPPAHVKSGRVMVPLRFIMEDENLNARVIWNSRQHQVSVHCREQRFEFCIGQKLARVNGRDFKLDVPPYIYQGRTFLPLRFFSTHLGASITWQAQLRKVVLDFQPQPRVFAYYYGNGFAELRERATLLTDVAFRWYQTDERGRVTYEYSDSAYGYRFEEVAARAKQEGLRTHASLMLFDRQKLSVLLNSPENRDNLIKNLREIVKQYNFDGVNIDFEFIDPADKDSFTRFLQELKAGLGKDKTVSVAVFARTGAERWPTAYDYKALGQASDLVVIMAYDYNFDQPGPLAPINWCEEVLDYAIQNIPREKILMGIGAYGYDWEKGVKKSVTQPRMARLRQDYRVQESFDRGAASPFLTYWDKEGDRHVVWYENRASLEAKWKLYKEKGIAGISYWKMDGALTDFYDMLAAGLAQ